MPFENLRTFLRFHPDASITKVDHANVSIHFHEKGREWVMLFENTKKTLDKRSPTSYIVCVPRRKSMTDPLWNMVREKYPEARLVEIWGDSVEFRLDGILWMATFDPMQTKIEGVWDMSSDLDDNWDALEQEKLERIARFGF